MKILKMTLVLILTMASHAWPQSGKPKTIEQLAIYTGSDREQILLDGAKAEGKVVWYTSLSGGSYEAIVDAFRKKYPDIELEVYRAGSTELSQKILGEAQANRNIADAIESTPPILMLLREKGLIKAYTTPVFKKYPEEAKAKANGDQVFWVTNREAFIGFAYNTKLIPPNAVPKSFNDLLRPELKGKMAFSIESTGDRVIGTMLKFKGKEYVDKFKAQGLKLFKLSGSALRDVIISGEMASSPAIFQDHALVKIEQGAPLAWVPMDVVPTNAGGTSLFSKAPHPHAALLLIDFIIGPEGQDIFEKFKYGVAWKEYPFKRYYPEREMSSGQYQRALRDWHKIVRSLGRQQ
jgi:iron(III) transport system substrate-binding protein